MDVRSVSTASRLVDGGRLYVDTDEGERGSAGPLYPAYTDADHTDRYGYVCGACESPSVAMDPMGRIECVDCGNSCGPSQWDAAYL